jgi:predicted RNA binding protein YcfA (HicA-like mRNA interferase family)
VSTFASISGAQLIKALRKLGFEVICIKGSHHFLRHPDRRCTVVPAHRSEAIDRGLLAQSLRDCDIARDELQEQLRARA